MDRKFDNVFSCYFAATCVAFLVSQVRGKLVVAPENQVALLGESVKLNCSTDLKFSVGWLHTPFGSTTPKDVYISRTVVEPYHPRFTVQREELGVNRTAYNLVVTDVRVEDAGTYRCVDRTGMGERRDAELTVLGSLPECTTNIGPNGFIGENDCDHPIDKIRSSCSIEYTGNIVPKMKWMTISGQDTIQSQPITNVSEKTVSSEWSFKATTSMNGASVIWFSTQSTQTKWISAPIKIIYAKQNVTKLILSRSETVTCTVNSSQHCNYTWTEETDEFKPIEGQTLEVKKPGTYLCRAHCPLHQRPCTVEGPRVEYRNEFQSLSFIVLVISVSCVVVGVTLFAIAIWKRKSIMKQCCFFDSPPSPESGLLPPQDNLQDSHSRTVSNGTSSSSDSSSSSSAGSDKPFLSKKSNSNGNSKSLAPPAWKKERQVDV